MRGGWALGGWALGGWALGGWALLSEIETRWSEIKTRRQAPSVRATPRHAR
jgi:hypothetical protein